MKIETLQTLAAECREIDRIVRIMAIIDQGGGNNELNLYTLKSQIIKVEAAIKEVKK